MYTCKTLIATTGDNVSQEKRLSICLEANGFSFSETTPSGELLTFGVAEGAHAASITDATRDVKAFFSDAGVRPLGYKTMELIVMSDASTWVPDELYTMTANRQYLKLIGCNAVSVMTCHSSALGSTAVFAGNEQLAMAFKVALPGLSVINQHAKLVRVKDMSKNHPVLFAYWRKGIVDVAACKDGKYLFGNSLKYKGREEAMFRLVEVMKTYGLDDGTAELMLCGDVDRDVYAMMRPYFPKTTLYGGEVTRCANPEFKKLRTYRYALILM